ncbi:xanthine dehydrogenase family protein molybdopterin-binding subunit, partial [Oleiphilus sp. HI0066]|uniref:xanthine dehydrogenase family protein molybdopterin-binding subunit n=3 Tax=Oleiphilus TaxID=141450 RepID=UPI0012E7FF42
SNSLSSAWKPIRVAAAAVREMLEKAAADTFGVDASSVVLFDGVLTNDAGQTLNISEVIAIAAKQSVPSEPALKAKQDFRFIGKHSSRLDAAAKVQGTANFGIDASVDDMVFAVVLRSPAIGGRLKSFDASELNADKDFIGAYQIDTGVAVVATSSWKARKLSEKVSLDWDLPQELISTKAAFELYRDAASKDDGDVVREVGDAQEAIDNSSNDAIELEFEMPFLAHATMEPMNCLAHVQEDRADIWASTQGPDIAQVSVAKVTHLDLDEVHIHNQFIGGGFGRRLNQDFIGEAAEISMAAKRPVKLVWSREDDMKNDFYRPATFHRLQASVSDSGEVEAWKHHVVGPGVMDWYIWDAAP